MLPLTLLLELQLLECRLSTPKHFRIDSIQPKSKWIWSICWWPRSSDVIDETHHDLRSTLKNVWSRRRYSRNDNNANIESNWKPTLWKIPIILRPVKSKNLMGKILLNLMLITILVCFYFSQFRGALWHHIDFKWDGLLQWNANPNRWRTQAPTWSQLCWIHLAWCEAIKMEWVHQRLTIQFPPWYSCFCCWGWEGISGFWTGLKLDKPCHSKPVSSYAIHWNTRYPVRWDHTNIARLCLYDSTTCVYLKLPTIVQSSTTNRLSEQFLSCPSLLWSMV